MTVAPLTGIRAPARPRTAFRRTGWLVGPAVLAVLAALVRVPGLRAPLSPDEGGYLLVASQWSPGRSLYGDYWVDRPPVLIAVYDLADHAGGTVALRVIGIGAVVAAVLLAGLLGRLVSDGSRRAAWSGAVVAAVFLSTPLFGTAEVNGELLATPLVLSGVVVLVASLRASAPTSVCTWAFLAGVLGISAALVKQNLLDVFVFAAVVTIIGARPRFRRGVRPDVVSRAIACVAGAVVALAVALWFAALHGTPPAGLWDALVVFRLDAITLIRSSASEETNRRLIGTVLSFVLSGAALVAVTSVVALRRPVDSASRRELDLRAAAVAVLAWEGVAAALGGSYWLHYLIALVPGLVLVTVTRPPAGDRRTTAASWSLGLAAASTLAVALWGVAHPPTAGADQKVSDYIAQRAQAGDSIVVAYGHPNLIEATGLSSPYPFVWSLPARVSDPRAATLTRVLRGSRAPAWVVVGGASLGTWGIDPAMAQRVLDADYLPVAVVGDWHVFRHRSPAAVRLSAGR
jgi:hypothetical protein